MEKTLNVPMALDDEGYLRQACPACWREFKLLASQSALAPRQLTMGADAVEPVKFTRVRCPYCAHQTDMKPWMTRAQQEFAKAYTAHELLGPSLAKLDAAFKKLGRSGGGMVKVTSKGSMPHTTAPQPLHEPNDMRVVKPSCHPANPVKVTEGWSGDVHCLACGTAVATSDGSPTTGGPDGGD